MLSLFQSLSIFVVTSSSCRIIRAIRPWRHSAKKKNRVLIGHKKGQKWDGITGNSIWDPWPSLCSQASPASGLRWTLILSRTVRLKSSFFQLRQPAKMKPVLLRQHFETVIHAFDYSRAWCVGSLVGPLPNTLRRVFKDKNDQMCLCTSNRTPHCLVSSTPLRGLWHLVGC